MSRESLLVDSGGVFRHICGHFNASLALEYLLGFIETKTSHEHAAGLRPLSPSIRGQDADGWQLFVLAGSHPADLVQLSQQVSFVQAAEVDHDVQDKELANLGKNEHTLFVKIVSY